MSSNTDRQYALRVTGLVQGVSFRAFTKGEADRLGLAGWVRNLSNGAVQVLIQGNENNCLALIQRLQQGPPSSQVAAVEVVQETPSAEIVGFKILR